MLWTFKRARGSSIATILLKMVSVKFCVSFSELLGTFAQAANKQSLQNMDAFQTGRSTKQSKKVNAFYENHANPGCLEQIFLKLWELLVTLRLFQSKGSTSKAQHLQKKKKSILQAATVLLITVKLVPVYTLAIFSLHTTVH